MNKDKKEYYILNMTNNLKMLRAKVNLTQEQLCDLIGVSRQTLVLAEQHKKLSWNTYMSLVFLFSKNSNTNMLMNVLDIYPTEIDNIIENNFSDKEAR